MSRLDSFIRRMTAQRDILNAIRDQSLLPSEGHILELGLGNGRTFSHLRELYPQRRIVVFDRVMQAHASSVPETENLVIGEIEEQAKQFVGCDAAMVHADIGSGSDDVDALTLQWLPDLTASLLADDGIAVCGLPLSQPELVSLPLPDGIDSNRYFLYRKRS